MRRAPRARGLLVGALLASAAVGCASSAPVGAERVTLADGSSALVWGDGEYGVVLVVDAGETPEDWAALAKDVAANRMMVVAPYEPASADQLSTTAAWLTADGAERVAYVASGVNGAALVAALAAAGSAIDQLILISGDLTDAEVTALGEPPKLFVAAEGDGEGSAEAERLTDKAAGTWNALLLVSGSARASDILGTAGADQLISGIVTRLEERR